jgi:DNA repair ATPase RecN
MFSPFARALLSPFNLSLLVLAVFAGLVAAWWLFPLGLVFWGVMMWSAARDPAARIARAVRGRPPLAARFQPTFDRIERTQVAIFNAVAGADSRLQRVLRPIEREASELTEQVHRLGQRMTAQENYRIVTEANSNLSAEMARLEQQIADAHDLSLRGQLERSRQALETRLARFNAVVTQLDRFEALLETISHELDGTLAEVTQLQSLEPDQAGPRATDLTQCLQQRTREVAAFEKTTPGG